MNIFVVDEHPIRAAHQMVDKHIVKMILEAGQMLSTSHRVLDGDEYYDKTKNGRRIKRWRLSDEREGQTLEGIVCQSSLHAVDDGKSNELPLARNARDGSVS